MEEKINSRSRIVRNKTAKSDKIVKIKTENNGFGAIKTLFVGLIILLQFAILLSPYFLIFNGLRWYVVFAFIVSIITSIYVLSSNKNSQSKVVWILFLLLFNSFGYIVFFLSDERIFFRKQQKRYRLIYEKSYNFQAESKPKKDLAPEFQKSISLLENMGNFASYSNSKLDYYSSGTVTFDNILKEIEKAKSFIFIESFIISDGVLLKRLLNRLYKKAGEGVEIRIIYDDMGCHRTLSRKTKNQMMKNGIKLAVFNQLLSAFSIGLNYRDHRKIFVIDGKVAFTGGINIADEYVNEKRMHGYWKDSGLKIEGPAVDGLTLTFLRQWEFVCRSTTNYSKFLNQTEGFNINSVVVPFADGLDYQENIGRNAISSLISNAKTKLFLMTPYFIPDDVILSQIQTKAMSGVDVRIIVPEIPDKKMVYSVTRSNVERLLKSGVKVYVMKNSFVHSKVYLSDSEAIVGSINLDLRSFFQQFENAVYTNDKGTIKKIGEDFAKTISRSVQITDKNKNTNNLFFRMYSGLLRLISPFMWVQNWQII